MFLMVMEKGKQERMKLGRAVPDNRDACPERYGLGVKEQGTEAGRGSRAASASMATSRAFSNLP